MFAAVQQSRLPPGGRLMHCQLVQQQAVRRTLSRGALPAGALPRNSQGSRRRGAVQCSSTRDGGIGAGISFAQLPVSQQSISMAFQVLDRDEDGLISRSEACRLVAYYLALQQHKPPPATRRPLTWDQHLVSSVHTASRLSGGSWTGVAAACEAFVAAKVSGGLQAHPPRCSDLVWAAAGMAAAVLALGSLAAAARVLPVVGQWHQQGVPLLLGSFGTLAILLFGKPEAEPVRLWSMIAGQVGAAAIVVAVLQVWGAGLISRAAAMAAAVAWMMWSDCIHPPGGALVLMAMDNAAVQHMSWTYLLYPSLALSLGVLLPISAATNWLRRNYQFDAPWTAPGAATLQQKVLEWQQQQAAKQAAVLRQFRALELDRGHSTTHMLHTELHSPLARIGRLLRPILQLISFPKHVPKPQQQQQQQQQQRLLFKLQEQQQLGVRGVSLDLGGINLGRSILDASPAEEAAAAAMDAAIRRRLLQEQQRRLEDKEHKRRMWGGAANMPDLKQFEDKLNTMHQQRMQQLGQHGQLGQQGQLDQGQQPGQQKQRPGQQPEQPGQQQQGQPSKHREPPRLSKQAPEKGSKGRRQQQQGQPEDDGAAAVVSPRQRLEQYWAWRAKVTSGADSNSSNSSSSGSTLSRSSSPQVLERPAGWEQQQQQQRQKPGSDGSKRNSSRQSAMDSFCPEDE